MRVSVRQRGFSLIEMVVVASILLIVAAMAVPNTMEAIYDARLRAAGTELAGLMQQARMMAIKDNSYYPIKTKLTGGTTLFYIDTSATRTTNTTYSNTFPTVQLGGRVAKTTTNPDSGGTSTPWGFTALGLSQEAYWGALGLPCMMSSGRCVTSNAGTTAGYLVILSDSRPFGAPGYISVSASPGGRIHVWRWTGTAWK